MFSNNLLKTLVFSTLLIVFSSSFNIEENNILDEISNEKVSFINFIDSETLALIKHHKPASRSGKFYKTVTIK